MEIEKVKISELKYAPYNPRKISKFMLERLKKSIEEFGIVEPLVVNKQNMQVIGGNQRLKVLQELKIDEVPVVLVDLDDEKEKILNIALNKIQGEWDFEKLNEVFKEIKIEFTELTGFKRDEIENLLKDFKLKRNPYTFKIENIQYIPYGNPQLKELYDDTEYRKLLEIINKSSVSEEIKEFLRLTATRFIKFNFKEIANYYASASREIQELFEQLLLVIIDFNDAIARGLIIFRGLLYW